MERRFGVLAGALIAVVTGARAVAAAPTTAAAKAAFAEGVAHYHRGEWDSASGAFASAYALEPDADALFAWAQAERKLGHCAKAVTLYDQLLAMPALPAANARAVATSRAECTALLAKQAPGHMEPPPPPTGIARDRPGHMAPPPTGIARDRPGHMEPPPPDRRDHVAPTSIGSAAAGIPVEPNLVEIDHRAWYRDAVGDGLVLTGLVALGAGTAGYLAGRSADSAKATAATYGAFRGDEARARRDARIGTAMMIGGGALFAGGIVWFATHRTRVTVDIDHTALALRGTF